MQQQELDCSCPEEITEEHYEGMKRNITVNYYERDPLARQKCLAAFGHKCMICGLELEKMYGEIAKGYIHVHHKAQLSEIKEEHQVDPKKDLVPVCPNCHAMLHRKTPPFTIDELKALIIGAST